MPANDPLDCASRCRCVDVNGERWLYLNAFCAYRDAHRPLADYGYPNDPISRGARQYHEEIMRERGKPL